MLSDEEKQSIESLKNIAIYIGDNYTFSQQGIRNLRENLRIVLPVIEKQSKEIEELKNADLTTVYLNGVYDGEKKVQDRIKAKIEEYDDKGMTINLTNRSAGKTFQQAVHYEVKKILQSLLEKE